MVWGGSWISSLHPLLRMICLQPAEWTKYECVCVRVFGPMVLDTLVINKSWHSRWAYPKSQVSSEKWSMNQLWYFWILLGQSIFGQNHSLWLHNSFFLCSFGWAARNLPYEGLSAKHASLSDTSGESWRMLGKMSGGMLETPQIYGLIDLIDSRVTFALNASKCSSQLADWFQTHPSLWNQHPAEERPVFLVLIKPLEFLMLAHWHLQPLMWCWKIDRRSSSEKNGTGFGQSGIYCIDLWWFMYICVSVCVKHLEPVRIVSRCFNMAWGYLDILGVINYVCYSWIGRIGHWPMVAFRGMPKRGACSDLPRDLAPASVFEPP